MNLITPSKAQTFCRTQSRKPVRRPAARTGTATPRQQPPHVLREVALHAFKILCRFTWRVFTELVIFLGLLAMHLARETYAFASTYRLPPSDEDYEITPTPYSSVGGKKVLGRNVTMNDLADAEEPF